MAPEEPRLDLVKENEEGEDLAGGRVPAPVTAVIEEELPEERQRQRYKTAFLRITLGVTVLFYLTFFAFIGCAIDLRDVSHAQAVLAVLLALLPTFMMTNLLRLLFKPAGKDDGANTPLEALLKELSGFLKARS